MEQVIEKLDLPPVCINLLTKDRTDYAVATVKNCLDKLKYEGKLIWHVSDGYSDINHLKKLEEIIPENMRSNAVTRSDDVGENWNYGIEYIFDNLSDIYLRLEDDMVLKETMDITTWVKLLMTKSVGMVRLGQIVIDLNLRSIKFKTYTHVGYTEEVYFRIYRSSPYMFSGHPALIHKRFHDSFGYYPTGLSPGETEVAMDSQVRDKKDGPMIVFPWDMGRYGTWGNWDHIGKEKSS
jgi:hypothetical protein